MCGNLLNAKETLMKLSLRRAFMSNCKMSISLQALQLTENMIGALKYGLALNTYYSSNTKPILLLLIGCQRTSTLILTRRAKKDKSPISLANWYLFLWLSPCQKNLYLYLYNYCFFRIPFGTSKKHDIYMAQN